MTCLLTILLIVLAALIIVCLWVHARRERSPVSHDFSAPGFPLRYVDLEPSEFSEFWEDRP
jgi:hypothetical protein